jgi:hypothetical protein
MDSKAVVDTCLLKLEMLLVTDYSAKGESLEDKIHNLTAALPAETRKRLLELVARGRVLERAETGEADLAEFVFECGVLYEQVDFLRKAQLAEDLGLVEMDGLPPAELERSELDAMARFIVARDRLVAKVASFTLKALAVMGALFVIGLVFGIV